ncbi:MAG TPA: glycosylase, partial [Pseudolysinimonas sp.]|nr:glycosylase [Pseudolysinimonas sp.]
DIAVLNRPELLWEAVQTGNCGSPIETDRGWLVLVHGVGPMRQYSIGALLLDLDDPTRVLARLTAPLLHPTPQLRDGYVPNVVYSCGGVVHDGMLWLPYGVGDDRIRVGSIGLTALLDAMTPA